MHLNPARFPAGLVARYDEEQFNQDLSAESPYRPHLRRKLYSATTGFNHEVADQPRQGVKRTMFNISSNVRPQLNNQSLGRNTMCPYSHPYPHIWIS